MIKVNHDMNPLVQDMPKQTQEDCKISLKHPTPLIFHYKIPIVMLKQKANTLAGTSSRNRAIA